MQKYVVEFIGAFFLTLTAVMTLNNNTDKFAPLAIGGMLLVMTYAGRAISGAHYNPAVSLAMLMRGKLDRMELPGYLLAQVIGAGVAALIGSFLLRCSGTMEINPHQHDSFCSVLAEFLGAFVLVYVFLQVTTVRPGLDNGYYGAAIAASLVTSMYIFASISGGIFNPALAFGGAVLGMTAWNDLWIYLLGNLLGGAAAATVFQLVSGPEQGGMYGPN